MSNIESVRPLIMDTLRSTGSLAAAAKASGFPLSALRKRMERDEDFASAVGDAVAEYHAVIEAEIHRRAIEGVEEPIYYKGELLDHKRVYDSRLLIELARRHIPEYRPKSEVDVKVTGGVLVVPLQQMSSDEWLEKFGSMEQARIVDIEDSKLPAPSPNTIDPSIPRGVDLVDEDVSID